MAGRVYSLEPRAVPRVETRFRRIVTSIPVPESIPILQTLHECEPVSMQGQPPIVWDRAEGFQVYDRWGNMWLDWSSGVLVTNAGHGHRELINAIVRQAQYGLLHSYCFPNEPRALLVRRLSELANAAIERIAGQGLTGGGIGGHSAFRPTSDAGDHPGGASAPEASAKSRMSPSARCGPFHPSYRSHPPYRVFLLTTGGETMENAIKLARTYGAKVGGPRKIGIVSFERAFHGRTLGAQQIGGIPRLKDWIGNLDPDFHQVPFPDGFRTTDTSFDLFLRSLKEKGVGPDRIAGVITETYQGGGADFAPKEYMQALAAWCREHDILLALDEVQAAFGRTGTFWGFEHYGIVPDLICCGKGITSSLPLGAVVGREDVLNLYGPGEMTSTHSGNPVCCAAALASLDIILRENLVENARIVGGLLHAELIALKEQFPRHIGAVHGKGLVAGLMMVKPGTKEPNGDLAWDIVRRCVEKGLMFFSPVGFGGATVKVAPPLCITAEAVCDGAQALGEAIAEAIQQHPKWDG